MQPDIERLKNVAIDLITNSTSEVELSDNIERLRMTLKNGSKCKKDLSSFKPRIHRSILAFGNGLINYDEHARVMNSIERSAIDVIHDLSLGDIIVFFESDEREGIIYQFFNHKNEFLYSFIGSLSHGKPHGQGKARYKNGDLFEGNFKMGLKHGYGRLFDESNRLLKTGTWENDTFIEKGTIEFFSNIVVAASRLKGLNLSSELDIKLMKVPHLTEEGMLGFPVVGDSMNDTFTEGDIVICKRVFNFANLAFNKPYVVYHEDELFLKFIQPAMLENGKRILRLISENYLQHLPFEIELSENTQLFKVVAQIKYF